MLETEVAKGTFTAWSFLTTRYAVSAFWSDEYNPFVVPTQQGSENTLSLHPVFDLASLTKPLFITFLLLLRYRERATAYLKTPLIDAVPKSHLPCVLREFLTQNSSLTWNDLLSHRAGLQAWSWLGQKTQDEMISYLLSHRLQQPEGLAAAREIYSDLGYFLAARFYEGLFLSDGSLSDWRKSLAELNQTVGSQFQHVSLQSVPHSLPFFPYCSKTTGDLLSPAKNPGPTLDTNANMFASRGRAGNIVSGHAGLFGSIEDIRKALSFLVGQNLLADFPAEKVSKNNRFVYGFDTPTNENSTAGIHHFDQNKDSIFGHLAYTGASFWVHAGKGIFQSILTNRTAHRAPSSSKTACRVYIIEDFLSSKKSFYRNCDGTVLEWSLQEWKQQANLESGIQWDFSHIPTYSDLAFVRRDVGRRLWDV